MKQHSKIFDVESTFRCHCWTFQQFLMMTTHSSFALPTWGWLTRSNETWFRQSRSSRSSEAEFQLEFIVSWNWVSIVRRGRCPPSVNAVWHLAPHKKFSMWHEKVLMMVLVNFWWILVGFGPFVLEDACFWLFWVKPFPASILLNDVALPTFCLKDASLFVEGYNLVAFVLKSCNELGGFYVTC